MQVRKLTCPSCGAQLDVLADLTRAHCLYCGAKLVVERVDEAERKAVQTHLELGRTALGANNYQEALEHFNRVLEADINNVEAWVGKARATHGLSTTAHDRLDEALRYIERAMELDSEDVAAREAREEMVLAHAAWLNNLGNKEWESAVDIAWAYDDTNPVPAHVHKALEYFHAAFRLNPDNYLPLRNIAWVLGQPGMKKYGDPAPYLRAATFLYHRETISGELVALREELSDLERQKQQRGFGLVDRRRLRYSRVKKRIAELESLVEAAAGFGIDTDV